MEGKDRVNPDRMRPLNDREPRSGPVIYWMQRDHRVRDNWALHYAQRRALSAGTPLHVVFILAPRFLGAKVPHYRFMLRGLQQVAEALDELEIGFHLLSGTPEATLPAFCQAIEAGLLVSDFSPLRGCRAWREAVAERIDIPHHEVDAHNVIPPWIASPKREYAARTLRPKLRRILGDWRTPVPAVQRMPSPSTTGSTEVDWGSLVDSLQCEDPGAPIALVEPGERAAYAAMEAFLEDGLSEYDRLRNDPNESGQSGLSPYLHFGHLGPGELVERVRGMGEAGLAVDAFLEEVLVRRELAENFCHYEPHYDRVDAFPDWAKKTLAAHAQDPREYLYTRGQLEAAQTHDPLWNAAQRQLVVTGKIHGYLRMYWAKKILEWTNSPATAMRIAIDFNDGYSFDGRDPNGYAGIAWSIGGVHDRAFAERPIFGKIRYMSVQGSRRKFDVDKYVSSMAQLEPFPFDEGNDD